MAKGGQWLQLFGLDRLGEDEPLDHHGLAARRLALSMVVGAGVLAVSLSVGAASGTSVTLGWDFAAILFLVSVGCSVWGKNPAASARIAQAEDSSRVAADAGLLSASVSSLVAVGFVLVDAGHSSSSKGLLIGLTIASVVLAWATVHSSDCRHHDQHRREPASQVSPSSGPG